VLHLISSLAPELGGTVELVRMLSTALVHQGCAVTVVSLDKDREILSLPKWISYVALPPSRLNFKYSWSFPLITWLRRNAQQFDVVIVHGVWQFPSLAALIALPRLRVPYIIYAHGMLTDHSLFRAKTKIPKKLFYWALVERRVLANAAAVVFTSEWEKIHSEKASRATKLRGVVIKNGLPPSPIEPQVSAERLSPAGPRNGPYFLCLGRLDPVKGIDIALRSFAAVNDSRFRLVIAGKGEPSYEQFLRKMVSDLNLGNRVHFIGHVHSESKWKLLREAHALLAPSHHENFGIAIVEALSIGCPVLTTSQVGVWREIERFQAGLLFSPNVEDCEDAIRRLVLFDDKQYLRFRRNALSCFDKEFSIDVPARALMRLVSSILDTKRNRILQ
jgi:glycosyltransferase involved in cell wall biosynthesis